MPPTSLYLAVNEYVGCEYAFKTKNRCVNSLTSTCNPYVSTRTSPRMSNCLVGNFFHPTNVSGFVPGQRRATCPGRVSVVPSPDSMPELSSQIVSHTASVVWLILYSVRLPASAANRLCDISSRVSVPSPDSMPELSSALAIAAPPRPATIVCAASNPASSEQSSLLWTLLRCVYCLYFVL